MKDNKVNVDSFKLITDKTIIDNEKKFLVVADIHIGKNSLLPSSKQVLKMFEQFLENQNDVDAILVPGDQIDTIHTYENSEQMKQLEYVLSMLGGLAPTILSMGNHDKMPTVLTYNEKKSAGKKEFKSLERINNVIPLDNEQITINDTTYTGFDPKLSTYNTFVSNKKLNKKYIDEIMAAGLKFNKEKLNVLLNHSPNFISSKEALNALNELYENVSLIVAGHLHNGRIPDNLERKYKQIIKDKGFSESNIVKSFGIVNNCRGAYILGKGVKSPVFLPEENETKIIEMLSEDKESTLLVVSKGLARDAWRSLEHPFISEIFIKNPDDYEKKDDVSIKR